MTTWIASLLQLAVAPHVVATVRSDGLLLQVQKVKTSRQTPPYLLTLDLRSSAAGEFLRVAEVRGESPEVCAEFVSKLLKVSQLGLSHQSK